MTPPSDAPRVYRSIFLSPGWVHQRYLGWNVAFEDAGVRLLQRRFGPFTKSLVLLTAPGGRGLPTALSRAHAHTALSDAVIHDFDHILGDPSSDCRLALRRADPADR